MKESTLKKEKDSTKKEKKSKGTRKTSDSRKRTLAAIFPGASSEPHWDNDEERHEEGAAAPPTRIVTIEEASVDSHGQSDLETPMKWPHPRPISDMLLGRSRPKAMYEDENENAMISLLDAATNDLAQLINRLDLEAMLDMTPMSGRSPSSFYPSDVGSPTKYRMTLESPIKTLHARKRCKRQFPPTKKEITEKSCPRRRG